MRTVFVIGPDKKIKLMLVYPMTTGRNFDEVLRVLDSMQLTAKHHQVAPLSDLPHLAALTAPEVLELCTARVVIGGQLPRVF